MNAQEAKAAFIAAGGQFHGPNVEMGCMPEELLLPFLCKLANREDLEAQLAELTVSYQRVLAQREELYRERRTPPCAAHGGE